MAGPRIALFGGSFDPPHLGHVLCALYARTVAQADEVWVLPVAVHAWAKHLHPWDERLALCRAAFADLPFVRIRDDEQRNPGGYMVNLVEGLIAAHPGHRFLLLGGTDTARDLPKWHRGADLARLVEVIAVPRRGYDEHPAALPAISSTLVRGRLAAGDPCRDLLPAAVADMIAHGGWYRADGAR